MDIVLVAGLWLTGSAWDEVVPALEELGHRPVPVTLPGQGDGATEASLDDQVAAVVAAVDAAEGQPLVVGHSMAASLAWLAADRRPDRVAGVVMVGGFPPASGEPYADLFEPQDGLMAFPGWEQFEGPDTADLDDAARDRIAQAAVPVPEGVTRATVELHDERRYDVPLVLVCPEYTPAQVREWLANGDLPELARARQVEYVDLHSGHWPMVSAPQELARVLVEAAEGVEVGRA